MTLYFSPENILLGVAKYGSNFVMFFLNCEENGLSSHIRYYSSRMHSEAASPFSALSWVAKSVQHVKEIHIK